MKDNKWAAFALIVFPSPFVREITVLLNRLPASLWCASTQLLPAGPPTLIQQVDPVSSEPQLAKSPTPNAYCPECSAHALSYSPIEDCLHPVKPSATC
jgi:hypothetical protein